MIVGTCCIEIHLPNAHSLKEKRNIIKSLLVRTRKTFNVSAAEVGRHDVWQRATLGVACVSGSKQTAEHMLQEILDSMEREPEIEVIGRELSII